MPRNRRKPFQTILVETVMFIGLFAIAGHLSVNFWERYAIQSELVKMKSSLYSMKDTLNYIGDAYDNLHREIVFLADTPEIKSIAPYETATEHEQYKSNLDRRTLHDMEVQAIINKDNKDREVFAAPVTISRKTDNIFQSNKGNSEATLTSFPPIQVVVVEKKDMQVGSPPVLHRNTYVGDNEAVHDKNATTITRYPLTSTGVGKEASWRDHDLKDLANQESQYAHKRCYDRHCHKDADYIVYNNTFPFWKF